MLLAFTRAVPPSIDRCELTHLQRTVIDAQLAGAQHERYEALLSRLGCDVRRLDPTPDLPDSVFVEDTAVVLDQLAVVARPGASSRRDETTSIAEALRPYRELHHIRPPATLDGGDVLRVGQRLFVGISARTTKEAVRQIEDAVKPFGYSVQSVEVRECLHLKSAVTAVADDLLLVNPAWVDDRIFEGLDTIDVDPEEPFAANVLRIGDELVCAEASSRTIETLRARGFVVHTVDMSELAKAEGGVTCCSVLCYVSARAFKAA